VGEALTQIVLAPVPLLHLGLPDEFIEHGDPVVLMSQLGLDAAGIEKAILARFGAGSASQ
jgi:1-deoxy-D-xylulose-5-phosphate synthase